MSIYAKKYDFNKSSVQLNPIRAKISLLFPENKTTFDKDIELFGVSFVLLFFIIHKAYLKLLTVL